MPLSKVGTRHMQWGEALRLAQLLAGDPSSAVAAALNGWSHSISREGIVLADLFDSTELGRVGRKAKRYPRPWQHTRRQFGRSSLTREQLHAILDAQRR